MAQLNSDIYRLIVDIITPTAKTPLDNRIVQQDCLAKMSNVSKTLYEFCSPELYKDCLVRDLKIFLQDLETNPRKVELCGHVSTLRVYQRSQYRQKDAHSDLGLDGEDLRISFSSDGESLDPQDSWRRIWDSKAELRERLEETVEKFARIWKANETAFSSLTRVIITETQHDKDPGTTTQQRSAAIPRALLNIPTVQHYCQDFSTEQLGFDDCIVVSSPPTISTFHPSKMLETRGMGFRDGLPVVMGSTNRYMFGTHVSVVTVYHTAEDLEYDDVADVLEPIYNMLPQRSDYTDYPLDDKVRDPERNTTFELYHDLRQIVWTFSNEASIITAERSVMPSPLGRIQELFDMHLPWRKQQWEGRVLLKNAEECPPCSACGFPGYSAEWLGGRRV